MAFGQRGPLAALVSLAVAACGPSLSQLRSRIERSPRRRVAVFAFRPAPGAAASGVLASELMARELAGLGFDVVAATAPAGASEEALRATAREAGARCAVTGTVIELDRVSVEHPEEYEERVRTYTDAAGKQQPDVERILVSPGSIERVPVFRGQARLVDAETAAPLAEASTWTESPRTLRDAAAKGVGRLAETLARKFDRIP